MLRRRAGGILMHLTSLPSRYGVGDFGPQAYAFADFLKQAGANYWQMLPLTYPTAQGGYSPYNCMSAFAGNPMLISPEKLYQDGWLTQSELDAAEALPADAAAFNRAGRLRSTLLGCAFERFDTHAHRDTAYQAFLEQASGWLDDFAIFKVLKARQRGASWAQWPAAFRNRRKNTLERFAREQRDAIEREKFIQYLFTQQFSALKDYCNDNGILLFGDMPIYVQYDSADVWAHPELFKLDRSKKPRFIAGVPPDYFSKTGQLWGNPVYDWDANAQRGYRWWLQRLGHNLTLFDLLRIDHFRGFEAYWQVPAGHKTAVKGTWIEGPGADFFEAALRQMPQAALVAEDLGVITPAVRELIEMYQLPCMKVLQFAFNGRTNNTHLPFNHIRNSIVYTGTHDNNTTLGWFKGEASAAARKQLAAYLGTSVSSRSIVPEMIRLAMASPARLCILPMQDVLALGAEARMNTPSRRSGNWTWRMAPGSLKKSTANALSQLAQTYGRL